MLNLGVKIQKKQSVVLTTNCQFIDSKFCEEVLLLLQKDMQHLLGG